jgi:hypothetical protein
MRRRDPEIVSASEIASWAWCPESWRLQAIGAEPSNRADIARGELFHVWTAAFEERSRSASALGWWLLGLALLVALLAIALAGGS